MSVIIPHAGGLSAELECRVTSALRYEVAFSEQSEKEVIMDPPGRGLAGRIWKHFPSQITQYDIFLDEELLGNVQVITYQAEDAIRVSSVEFQGRIPGYKSQAGDKVCMRANEYFRADEMCQDWHPVLDLSRENNTAIEPLYRHDFHGLRLCDHEWLRNQ